jgi:hypothetical protein
MNLGEHVEAIRRQLVLAAQAGGEDLRASAERLLAPLEAAVRLAMLDALSEAVEEISAEMAPDSVELRMRGRDLDFVLTRQASRADDLDSGPLSPWRPSDAGSEGDEGGLARINLRMPEQLKAKVEAAASEEGLSANAWLVRAAAAGLRRVEQARRPEHGRSRGQHYEGWAR